ncbi:hypothetical protein DPMN_194685 [Dreissena polymorpha]|uniref:Uncharacterized protein n=1 Tax=Dreissena polymorpha TaxID=45954 RepID=A0A9D3Y0R5_DREPO|nr:hypothetical protein DPMN_194685 [Dreissena polymorpha]
MAASTSLFTDKEINNWCLALNITMDGLANFLDKELQMFHIAVGRSCGNCSIEKLIPCPTLPYCNNGRNNCRFHAQQPTIMLCV